MVQRSRRNVEYKLCIDLSFDSMQIRQNFGTPISGKNPFSVSSGPVQIRFQVTVHAAVSSFGDSRAGALSPEASDTTTGKNLSPALARALAKKAKAAGQSPGRAHSGDAGPSPGAMVHQSPRTPVSAAVDQQNAHHGRAGPLDEDEDLEVCIVHTCFYFSQRNLCAVLWPRTNKHP